MRRPAQERLSRQRARTLAEIMQRLDAMQATLAGISAATTRGVAIQGAVLDASPVENYDLLDMRTPRTVEEWDVASRSEWKLIRRRLVVVYGLQAAPVDAAKNYLMDQRATGYLLPRSDEALLKMVEAWKASEVEAGEYDRRIDIS